MKEYSFVETQKCCVSIFLFLYIRRRSILLCFAGFAAEGNVRWFVPRMEKSPAPSADGTGAFRKKWLGFSEKHAALFGKGCSTFRKKIWRFWEKAVRFFFCLPASFSGAGGDFFSRPGGRGKRVVRRNGKSAPPGGERRMGARRRRRLPRGQVPAPDGAGEAHDSGRSTSTGFSFMAFRTCR